MEIVPATVEQIAIFKQAAAQRYAELGVDSAIASDLFEIKMADVARDLGLVDDDPIEKLADALADSLGRERVKQAGVGATVGKKLTGTALKGYAKQLGRGVGHAYSGGKRVLSSGGKGVGRMAEKVVAPIGREGRDLVRAATGGRLAKNTTMKEMLAKGWKAGKGKNLAKDVAAKNRMRDILAGYGLVGTGTAAGGAAVGRLSENY